MFAKTALFITILIAAAVSATETEQVKWKRLSPLIKARRECRRQKALICNIIPVSGSSVSGKVLFTPAYRVFNGVPQCAVRVRAKVMGLTGKKHGFHIHMYGDTSANDGTSTGPHFANPEGTPAMHGYPNDEDRHWGDFGNLRNFGGTARYNRVDRVITLPGILGRGITIHAGKDQGPAEQPSGAAGPRIAVCVIGFANPGSLTM